MTQQVVLSWKYRVGMWLSSRHSFGLAPLGNQLMLAEIARLTASLSHMERNILLRRVNAKVSAELDTCLGQTKVAP